jgi:ribosomal protein S11
MESRADAGTQADVHLTGPGRAADAARRRLLERGLDVRRIFVYSFDA